ncbi:transciptional regulator [Shewanella denitrificans OS217]|jgi:HTH-type transcriptional regulator / antitoxin HipB|uniref:Transciptional regulator n=1 Tax=Shewanella denitrificans (strain OS217 / ATCC BAA-1090 / DSM 15013) TaxID=318161 RepID=Q12SH5_SHEDO|nr:helix-turn-helix domain-containing protein [Shewanella denitrificans]ABE53601.1 transciptional regulator [Shewanella denitrificans OS217]
MKVTNAKQLSTYLKDARLNAQLSQSKVASKVGIRQDTVSSFELNPDSTKLETLFKILSALNLELDIKVRNPQLVDERRHGNATVPEQEWKEEW